MKKEFSFYEIVGLIIPGSVLLFSLNFIISDIYGKQVIDFSSFSESIVFIFLCYGLGHLIQGMGNIFEFVLWKGYKGMPTKWLMEKNRFGNNLLSDNIMKKVNNKWSSQFGAELGNDYDRVIYNYLFDRNKTSRIDIFNGNYSLLRGLSISFLILTIICLPTYGFKITLILFLWLYWQ